MNKVQDVIDLIENYAPLDTQEKWDNSGWQINLGKENFSKIMTALTVTQSVINQAKKFGCDLILAHHPLIFEPLKSITVGEITDAIQNGIQVYSSHTNIDLARGGTTDTLSEKCGLGLCNKSDGFVNYKKLSRSYDLDFLKEDIKKRLGLDCLKIINLQDKKVIKSVGFCAGAGGGEIPTANRLGLDLFITGEVKFHEAFEAKNTVVFEVGHFDSEKYIGEIFKRILGNKYEIIEANEKRPYFYD